MSGVPTNSSPDGGPVAGAERRAAERGPAGQGPQDVARTAPDHRIGIVRNRHRVRVIHQGVTIADTMAALTLSETGCPDEFYFPRADVNMARLERSHHTSRCPHKGDASFFHLHTEDGLVENAVWTYEAPLDGVRQIEGYLAFYASRVDRIDQTS